MASVHADVIYFLRTQALRLLVYVMPVVVPVALWEGWALAHTPAWSSTQARVLLPSLIGSLLYTGLAVGAIDALGREEKPRLAVLWATALHRGPYLFAVQVLMGLACFGAALPLIVPGFYVAGRLLLVQVDAPLSQAGVREMLRTSWQRSRGHAWELILGYLMWMLLPLVVGVATQSLIQLSVSTPTMLTWLLYSLSYALSSALNLPAWIFLYRQRSLLEAPPV